MRSVKKEVTSWLVWGIPICGLLWAPSWRSVVVTMPMWWMDPRVSPPWGTEKEWVLMEYILMVRAMILGISSSGSGTLGNSITITTGLLGDIVIWVAILDRLEILFPGIFPLMTEWMDVTGIARVFYEIRKLRGNTTTTTTTTTTESQPQPPPQPPQTRMTVVVNHGKYVWTGFKYWGNKQILHWFQHIQQKPQPLQGVGVNNMSLLFGSIGASGWWMMILLICVPGAWGMLFSTQLACCIVAYVHSLPCVPPIDSVLSVRRSSDVVLALCGKRIEGVGIDWVNMRNPVLKNPRSFRGPSSSSLRPREFVLPPFFNIPLGSGTGPGPSTTPVAGWGRDEINVLNHMKILEESLQSLSTMERDCLQNDNNITMNKSLQDA